MASQVAFPKPPEEDFGRGRRLSGVPTFGEEASMEDERGKFEREKRANDEDDVKGHKYRLDEADKPSDDDVEAHKFQADKPDAESKRKR
jgi:hypothetical protein